MLLWQVVNVRSLFLYSCTGKHYSRFKQFILMKVLTYVWCCLFTIVWYTSQLSDVQQFVWIWTFWLALCLRITTFKHRALNCSVYVACDTLCNIHICVLQVWVDKEQVQHCLWEVATIQVFGFYMVGICVTS